VVHRTNIPLMSELGTARLLLRQWQPSDFDPFATLNADPEVMRFFPAVLTRHESDALAHRQRTLIAERGWGLWAVEVTASQSFIGFIGLAEPRFDAHFTPALEIGWRLSRSHWGYGYATEGARAALTFAFEELEMDEVVSFTSVINMRSRQVMDRLGMTRDPADDFDHPLVVKGSLRPHVLYRLPRPRLDRLAEAASPR
jgi:RimJ/RimL family protein N-acetyltransferase